MFDELRREEVWRARGARAHACAGCCERMRATLYTPLRTATYFTTRDDEHIGPCTNGYELHSV